MQRDTNRNIKIVAVILAVVANKPPAGNVQFTEDPKELSKYVKMIKKDLPSLNIFACEGSSIPVIGQ
jgi:hypothetical protein